jgi:hypothetical protein
MKKQNEIKKYDTEEAEKIALSAINFPNSKKALLRELIEDIIPKCSDPKNKDKEVANKNFEKKSMMLLRILESDSHVGLMESFNENYRMLSSEMTNSMIKEFDCSSESEKALVSITVNSYIRCLDNSRRLNNELECQNITPNRNIYIANLSKQLDRANRQFISAMITLKQMKSPQVEMNIKANTAFVSNNQQINLTKDENIKA